MKNISTDKLVIGIIAIFTVVVLVFIVIIASKESPANQNKSQIYAVSDKEKPIAKISSNSQDLGKMKVSDEKSAVFTITNSGTRPLILSGVSSSCDCTFGKITINGNDSPEMGMHSRGNWQGSLDPGKEAQLKVIYRPSIMPVSGEVSRQVFVKTNDPVNPELTFSVKAFVE